MKALKCLTAAVVAVLSSAALSAQTATTLRLTGSTAFRKAVVVAIQNILQPGYTYGYSGTSVTSANQQVFVGTTKTTNLPVVIKCSWAGSAGGVQTIAQQSPAITVSTWLSETLNTLTTTGAASLNSGNIYDSPTAADVAMSDVFQSSTKFYGTGYNTLVDNEVGVVPFVWTKGLTNDTAVQASLAKVTNMTALAARQILAGGAPLSLLTGDPNDASVMVYAMGRDEDSGTRITTLAESGFGVFSNPAQFQATVTSSTVTAIIPWPAATLLGFSYPEGHSGYAGGGQLAAALNAPVASGTTYQGSKFVLMGYFGVNDATAVNSGNNNLTYNGTAYSVQGIQEGQYTFWGYEHLFYRSSLAGNQLTVANQIRDQVKTADAVQSGVLLTSMHVSRPTEGGVISHN